MVILHIRRNKPLYAGTRRNKLFDKTRTKVRPKNRLKVKKRKKNQKMTKYDVISNVIPTDQKKLQSHRRFGSIVYMSFLHIYRLAYNTNVHHTVCRNGV